MNKNKEKRDPLPCLPADRETAQRSATIPQGADAHILLDVEGDKDPAPDNKKPIVASRFAMRHLEERLGLRGLGDRLLAAGLWVVES